MIPFLVAVVLIAGIIFWHVEVFAAMLATWYFITHLAWLHWILHHPWLVLLYTAGYFLVGAVWSVAKWWFEETDRVRKAKEAWRPGSSMSRTDYVLAHKSDPAHFKSDILIWISLWPISMPVTLLDDPVRRICRRIYAELQGVYQRITDAVWE